MTPIKLNFKNKKYTFGPPELHAIIGAQLYIASIGTIPKCSLSGV